MKTMLQTGAALEWGCWMPEYWLGRCQTFRVETTQGVPLGVVDEVVWSPDGGVVQALVVRSPDGRGRARVVPVADVREILPKRSLVRVRARGQPCAARARSAGTAARRSASAASR